MRLTAALGALWDVDHGSGDLSFEQEVAIVNLRRCRLIALLLLFADAVTLASGLVAPPLLARSVASILGLAVLPKIQRLASLRQQQATVIALTVTELALVLWGLAAYPGLLGTVEGFPLNLLICGMLLITPPATMAAIITSLFAVYCLIVVLLPLPHAAKTGALAITAIVAAIVQIASWLIYNARRSDHDQRRLIRAQYKLLARQNHELDELMAITAHDLRSPLHGLRNVLDFAARRAEGGDPAILLRAVREGTHSIDAMLTLVTRLLDANEAGHAPLVAVMRDDMRTHVLAAARRVAPQAVHAGIRLDLDLPNRAMWVNIDGGALGQILDNLLSNGIRHSPAGEVLRLACSPVGSNVLVTIEDRGPGMDPARRAALFTKFNRGDSRDPVRGAGMGLFIAATLAGRSNAGLVFRPAEPHGALFELSVPIVP